MDFQKDKNYPNRSKSTKSKGGRPPPPKKKGKSGVSNRLAMFEEKDKQAGKGKDKGKNKGKSKSKSKPKPNPKPKPKPKLKPRPPPKKTASQSDALFLKKKKNKNKNKNKDTDKSNGREKNLRPSLVKKRKTPPSKSAAPPPPELKSVNVDWKAQREKMTNAFKKKEEDKDKELCCTYSFYPVQCSKTSLSVWSIFHAYMAQISMHYVC